MAEGDNGAAAPEGGPVEASELQGIASQAAYDSFLVAARTVELGFIEECCTDIALAYHTVTRAVEQVLGSGTANVKRLPSVNVVELSMLPRLVQGLAFAALQVERELAAASFTSAFTRLQLLRRVLRKSADALAEARLLSDEDIDEVWLHARHDVLEDTQSLVAVFRRNESRLAGRSPVASAQLREAEQLVDTLRAVQGQQAVPQNEGSSLFRAVDMRDRFWTLLTQRYDVLWRCGAWLFGRAVEEHVPPLPLRPTGVSTRQATPTERPAARGVLAPPPALVHAPPPPAPVRSNPALAHVTEGVPSRHLQDLQGTLERKTRFLVKLGVIPSQR